MITRSRASIGGRGRSIAAVDPEVDRDIQDPRPLGKIHAEEEDVGPAAVRQVEPHRRLLDQDGEEGLVRLALEQPRMDPQRVLVDAADPEHPAVALAAPDRAPHLVGQGLKGDLLVGLRQRADRSRRWARRVASSRERSRSPARSAAPSGP